MTSSAGGTGDGSCEENRSPFSLSNGLSRRWEAGRPTSPRGESKAVRLPALGASASCSASVFEQPDFSTEPSPSGEGSVDGRWTDEAPPVQQQQRLPSVTRRQQAQPQQQPVAFEARPRQ